MIKVHFFDRDNGDLVHVADVDTDDLEVAWRRTNNVGGSWSRGEYFGGVKNPDYSPLVKVLEPLPVYDGVTYGHRSAMVDDIFEKDGVRYRVAPFGFEEIEGDDYA